MNDFSEYSIRVGTDAGYYGSQCTDADALRIAADVAKLIEGEFPGINVTTGETSNPSRVPTKRCVTKFANGWRITGPLRSDS